MNQWSSFNQERHMYKRMRRAIFTQDWTPDVRQLLFLLNNDTPRRAPMMMDEPIIMVRRIGSSGRIKATTMIVAQTTSMNPSKIFPAKSRTRSA